MTAKRSSTEAKKPALTDEGKALFLRLYAEGVPLHQIRVELSPISPDGIPNNVGLGTIASNAGIRRPADFSYDRGQARRTAAQLVLDAPQERITILPLPQPKTRTEAVTAVSRLIEAQHIAAHYAPVPYTMADLAEYADRQRIAITGNILEAVNAWRTKNFLPPFTLRIGVNWPRLPAPHIGGRSA